MDDDEKYQQMLERAMEERLKNDRIMKLVYVIVIAMILWVVLVEGPQVTPEGYEPDESSQHIRCGPSAC